MQKHHNLRAIDGVDLQNVARGNNSFDIYQAAKEQGVSPAYLSIINDTYPKLGIADFWDEPTMSESSSASLPKSVRLAEDKSLLSNLSWSISKAIQFPVNTIFAHGLGVIASAMSKSFKFKYGFSEKPVNLYVVTAQPPSTGKSGVNEFFYEPVELAFDAVNKTAQAERKKIKIRMSAIKREMKNAKVKEQQYALEDEMAELYEQHDKHIVYTHSVTDPTAEGLSKLASKQDGIFNIISAEADAINIILGNVYSDKKANHGLFLSGWDAERVTVARSSEETRSFVAVGNISVIAQDESIRTIFEAGMSGRGISERFLMIRDKTLLGTRDFDSEANVSELLMAQYSKMIFNIVRELGVTLTFCEDSKQLIKTYRKEIEPEMGDCGKYANNMMRGFVGKSDKQIMKIACVLHAIDNWADGGSKSSKVLSETTARAIKIFRDMTAAYVSAADDMGFTGVESEYEKIEERLQKYAQQGKLLISMNSLRSGIKNVKPFSGSSNLTSKLKDVILPYLQQNNVCIVHGTKIYINPHLKD